MWLEILGSSHLAQTLATAARIRNVGQDKNPHPLVVVAEDIVDHTDIDGSKAKTLFDRATGMTAAAALVLVSQVPPGTTRRWAQAAKVPVFYQVDTIIMKNALERMLNPEQVIIGCSDPTAPLPLEYQEYLLAFGGVVKLMTYEEAELAKCAINYCLAKQIATAIDLAVVAKRLGADYAKVQAAVQGDARIGPKAYMRPGLLNQHLLRDVKTIVGILHGPTDRPLTLTPKD